MASEYHRDYMRQYRTLYGHEVHQKNISKICRQCGIDFFVASNRSEQKTCSNKCARDFHPSSFAIDRNRASEVGRKGGQESQRLRRDAAKKLVDTQGNAT